MLATNERIDLLVKLGAYMSSEDEQWEDVKYRAINTNAWFTKDDIELASENITTQFLQKEKLENWVSKYTPTQQPKKVGIIAAGNIPMVGFHDMLCGFISGHNIIMKLSSKDDVLLRHLIAKLIEWNPETGTQLKIADMLKGCDAYIATGSNNSARYFEQYFAKYPHIIRKNRTSVAVLDGNETGEELRLLGKDVFSYLGLGCRNVTQVWLPEGYEIPKIFDAFASYNDIINHNKYKNNYDYYLAIYLLNRVPYMTNDFLLMIENDIPFSAVSVLHYKYYNNNESIYEQLKNDENIQCIVGHKGISFGESQVPSLDDYADNVDTMKFLTSL
jgi:hypothetical protein